MQTEELPSEALLPPKRLGAVLEQARVARGVTLAEAADRLGAGWSPAGLSEVEKGLRRLPEPGLARLTAFYGISTTSLIPERSRLVIDLDEGVMDIGGQQVCLGTDSVGQREVLVRYLAMVYTMRGLQPDGPVSLRSSDLEVLGSALQRPPQEIERELRRMMLHPRNTVEPRMARLRSRVLIPAVGLIVAGTSAGMLVLVNDSGATPVPEGVEEPAAVTTDVGDAVVQDRLPDGTPGPVTVRD